MKKVIISSNCQTGSLLAALKYILPSFHFIPFPAPEETEIVKLSKLRTELEGADAWITTNTYDFEVINQTRILKIPRITFFAFHPDITYARIKSTGQSTRLHYNSRIALWAYNKGLSVEDALQLFNGNVYKSLGFLDCWDECVEFLKQRFLNEAEMSDKDFRKFYLSVKRAGNFMHTINHPTTEAMICLAKIIAEKLNGSAVIFDSPISIPDTLSQNIWPVYNEIAGFLGIEGSYTWKIDGNIIHGIHDYLTFTFQDYIDQNISRNDIEPQFPFSRDFLEVLEGAIKT